MKNLTIALIKIYRNYLSIFKLCCCRFHPSCSQYAMDAIEKYGFFLGAWKSIKRVARCHPFSPGGYDPVT